MSLVDRIVGLAAVLGGILLAIAGWQLDLGTSKLPGPGFFPLLIALTMGGLGLWLLLRPGRDEKPLRSDSSRWISFTLALLFNRRLCGPFPGPGIPDFHLRSPGGPAPLGGKAELETLPPDGGDGRGHIPGCLPRFPEGTSSTGNPSPARGVVKRKRWIPSAHSWPVSSPP
jgi:hypothetical protein